MKSSSVCSVSSVVKKSALRRQPKAPVLNEVFGNFGSLIKHATSANQLDFISQAIRLSQGLNEWERTTLQKRVIQRAADLDASQTIRNQKDQMKTTIWTCNLAVYHASKGKAQLESMNRLSHALAPAKPRAGSTRWYGGTDPAADFRQARFTMLLYIAATLVIAGLFSLLSAFTL
jgi:hypothetical protein